MPISPIETARCLEHAITTKIASFIDTARRLRPEYPAAWEPHLGGTAAFFGVGNPITKATGIGMSGPVSDDDFDRLERFYTERGAVPRLEVCPLADQSLHDQLKKRNYRYDVIVSTHVRELAPHERFDEPRPDGITVEQITETDVDLYADTIGRGFSDGRAIAPEFMDMGRAGFHKPDSVCFLARADGQPAAGGGADFTDTPGGRIAALFGAATLPDFRKRGAQTALIRARLREAVARGCTLAVIQSRPGTPSERNIARAGFRLAYNKLVVLAPAAPTPAPAPAAAPDPARAR